MFGTFERMVALRSLRSRRQEGSTPVTAGIPQRGIGLARWSIVLAYFTLAGSAYFVLTTWAR